MIKATEVTKTYITGKIETPVLKGVNLEVKKGEFVAIMGRSGAGKSTLLYQLSVLDRPTSGSIVLDNTEITDLTERDRTQFRLDHLGFVFQDYALVPELSALENVMIPLLMRGFNRSTAAAMANEALEKVGLPDKDMNLPNQLSGGQQQRVSIARAVAGKPKIIFADEPTANLDSASAWLVIDLLSELHQAGQTIVMVTHEAEYAKKCDRTISMADGRIE